MINFLFSRHKWQYTKIAFRHMTTPLHVYNIAHGKNVRTQKERKIAHDLLKLKIIHRHTHSANPDDYDM